MRTCVAFRDIRGLAETAVLDAADAVAEPERPPVIADLAAGSAPYLLRALAARPRVRAVAGDIDPGALAAAAAAARKLGVDDRLTTLRADAFDRAALAALPARPDVVVELGLYGIYHDDRRIERHFADLAELVAPRQIVFNVQTQNPEIEYIARVWRNAAGGPCVWRLRPVGQILGYAAAAGYEPASETADRHGIYRVVPPGAPRMSSVLTWSGAAAHRRHRVPPPAHPARQPQRDVELRHLPRRHRHRRASTPTRSTPTAPPACPPTGPTWAGSCASPARRPAPSRRCARRSAPRR